jgi:predicted Ser/Thr protein kinase
MALRAAVLPDRYQDARLIAVGGMGEVYRATDTVLGRTVAIKLLDERHASDETVRKRFTREALAAARVSSEPGIVMIFDVGENDGRPFIVMEYLPGGTLQEVIARDGAQPVAHVLRWLAEAAQALDRAHARGIVHRDVKPGNLLLDGDGRVHVADFGVASAAGLASLTATGTVIGTAGYLSPEQAQGSPATPASDRYSLAVVAWELLAGVRPFENANAAAEATAHVWSPVPALPGAPQHVDAVFTRALAKSAATRFQSNREFVAALSSAFVQTATPTRVIPAAPARRRGSMLPLLVALLVIAAAGGAAAIVVANRGSVGATKVVRVTVTRSGTTVLRTITTHASPPPATTAAGGASAAAAGYAKIRAGDYAGALPLLEQAAQRLQGDHSLDEAYNDFNLALTLAKTQGCSDQVLRLLDESQAIQGRRTPIDELRAACTTPPSAPPGHARGPKPGKGPKHGND